MELFIDLGLREISSIIGIMGKNLDLELEEEIEVNGKDYIYIKKGNELIIKGEDGKVTTIKINYSLDTIKKNDRDIVYPNHEVYVSYVLKNNYNYSLHDKDCIKLYNNILLDGEYEAFEDIPRHVLMDGLKCTYGDIFGNPYFDFSLDLNTICIGHDKFEFDQENVKYGDFLFSNRRRRLISIKGVKVPKYEDAVTFFAEEEKEKIDDLIIHTKLHNITLDLLNEFYKELYAKETFAKKSADIFKNNIEYVELAKRQRGHLMVTLPNSFIGKDVLEEVEKNLKEKTKKKCKTKALIH